MIDFFVKTFFENADVSPFGFFRADDRVEKNTISVTTSTFHQKHYIVFHTDSIDTVT